MLAFTYPANTRTAFLFPGLLQETLVMFHKRHGKDEGNRRFCILVLTAVRQTGRQQENGQIDEEEEHVTPKLPYEEKNSGK